MKYTLIIVLFLIAFCSCQVFNVSAAEHVSFPLYLNNLQIYANWFSDQNGPNWNDLQYGVGQQLFFACLSALDNNFLSIVAQAPFNNTLGIGSNTSNVAPNGNYFFKTTTSFGYSASGITFSNCSLANGSSICFNMNASTNSFIPGGYCGSSEGYQQQPSVQLIIFSAPCLNSTVGSPCLIPGVGYCASNATCEANYLCNGTSVLNPAPVLSPSSCLQLGECAPSTGVYAIFNAPIYTPCYNGNPCIAFERCNSIQQCVNGSLACNVSSNVCDGPAYCNITTNYTCAYDPTPRNGLPCSAAGGFPCRQQDTCLNHNCIYGASIPPPPLDPYCAYSNATCNNVTRVYDFWLKPNGTFCMGPDKCKTGSCAAGACGSFVSIPSPLVNVSACLSPACNSSNGQWYTVSGNNVGGACQYPNATNQNPCQIGICDSNDNCLLQGPFTCPRNASQPCMNYTCNPLLPLGSQCQPIPLTGNPCNINSCNVNGTCGNGACLNTTVETCANFAISNQCAAAQCGDSNGCRIITFNSSFTCNNTCFVGGVGNCDGGICALGTLIPIPSCTHTSSFASTLLDFYIFFF